MIIAGLPAEVQMNNNANRQSSIKKKKKTSRSAYVITVAVLMVLSVIVAVVSASNRNKPNENPTTSPATLPPTSEARKTDAPKTQTEAGKTDKKDPVSKPTKETLQGDPTDAGADVTDDTPVIAKLPEFSVPVNGLVMKHHSSDTPVFSQTMNDYRVHLGIDIEAEAGDPVVASADGVVSEVWTDPMMGRCVSVSHDGGAVSVYKNLAYELAEGIEPGAKVKQGDVLGAAGESAIIEIADETHVHYEMMIDGVQVDPEEYIDFSRATASYAE